MASMTDAAPQTKPCVNCGSRLGYHQHPGAGVLTPWACRDCDWPQGKPVPDAPLCSICRRRHGKEVQHASE